MAGEVLPEYEMLTISSDKSDAPENTQVSDFATGEDSDNN